MSHDQIDPPVTRIAVVDLSTVDRLRRLRVTAEAATCEMAAARRESARVRAENRRLLRQIAELQARIAAAPSL